MKRSTLQFQRLCAYESALESIPLDSLRICFDSSRIRVAFQSEQDDRVFTGNLYAGAVDPWINGWVLGLLCNAMGRPFEPFMPHRKLMSELGALDGLHLTHTIVREGFNLLVDSYNCVYGVIGKKYVRPCKQGLHAFIMQTLRQCYKQAIDVEESEADFGRLRMMYSTNGNILLHIVFGNDTGCSAYEIRSNNHMHGSCFHRHWRHNDTIRSLFSLITLACIETRRNPFALNTLDNSISTLSKVIA